MASQFVAGAVDDVSGLAANTIGQPTLGVTIGNEANVIAVRFLRYRKPATVCFGANVSF